MNELEEMYQEVILEESKNPKGKVQEINDEHSSHQFNPTCGDDIELTFSKNGEVIEKVEYAAEGCSISVSSASIMTKLVEKKTLAQAKELISLFKKLMNSKGEGLSENELDIIQDAAAFTGTSKFPGRIKCALLPWMALEDVIEKKQVDG